MTFLARAGIGALVLSMAALTAPAALGDEAGVAGRALLEKYKQAVVTVRIVVNMKMAMGGQSRQDEQKLEVTGTVIDPSGLTVLSLSETDPGAVFRSMAMDDRFQVETELKDIQILQDDGTEISCEIALRDEDLDLAFIRPKTAPAAPLAAVDLTTAGEAQLLDEVIMLNRLGRVASRAYSASVDRIESIVERPRRFYIPSKTETNAAMGSPVFTLDGKPLGVVVLRAIKGQSAGSSFRGGADDSLTPIVLPAADVLEVAAQVGEGKSGEAPGEGAAPEAEEQAQPAPQPEPEQGPGAEGETEQSEA